ncbi:MAG: AAA family ATPase [Lachnospiraceae bacterium]|nr:AAA family ATPase [Lachnospiraceae bacterium]
MCNQKHAVEKVILPGQREIIYIDRHLFSLKKSFEIELFSDNASLTINTGQNNMIRVTGFDDPVIICRKDSEYRLVTVYSEVLMCLVYFSEGEISELYKVNERCNISIGSALTNTICILSIPRLSPDHLCIENFEGRWRMRVGGMSGCYLNGAYLASGECVYPDMGDEILLWEIKLLWLKDRLILTEHSDKKDMDPSICLRIVRLETTESDLSDYTTNENVLNSDDEEIYPLPRIIRPKDLTPVALEAPPQKKEIKKDSLILSIGPAFTMALPMLAGTSLALALSDKTMQGRNPYMYTGLITASMAALIGSMWAFINLKKRKADIRREERKRKRLYGEYIENAERRIREKYISNRNSLIYMYPPVTDLIRKKDRSYLWNRDEEEEDYLYIRLGKGELESNTEVEIPKERLDIVYDELKDFPVMIKERFSRYRDVPVTIDLKKNRVTGVLCEGEEGLKQIIYLIVSGICYCISPGKIRILVISVNDLISEEDLRILRFLPHLRNEAVNPVFGGEEAVNMLRGIERERRINGEDNNIKTLIISDDISLVRGYLKDKDLAGMIIYTDDYTRIPRECGLIIQSDDTFKGVFDTRDAGYRREIDLDAITDRDIRQLSILLNRVGSYGEGGIKEIPDKVLMSDIYENMDIDSPGSISALIRKNYTENDTVTSIMAPIGFCNDNRLCYLDVHEKGFGPHGLIAGMTGSGKSELLQTMILSFAIRYSPSKVNFFLIDYKGGGMANMFSSLPHLCGSISNLSGNLTGRAMVSIRAENERRQKIFLSAGVNNITEYEKKYISGELNVPLPHILIIIDEFAELKKNEPEFMKELISVAQVGRSLGVHLILATQKPSGVVDENIYSNSRFRIALKVQDRMDSMDMLHKPDASRITRAGRAFIQVGNDEYYEEFQSAYSMNVTRLNDEPEYKSFILDKRGNEHSVMDKALREDIREKEDKPSDLKLILEQINEETKRLGIKQAGKLWMKELPEKLFLEDIKSKCEGYEYITGMYDAPRKQEQRAFTIDLRRKGNHIICGRSGSGKSTLLRTLLYSVTAKETPDEINIYIIDHSAGALSVFEDSDIVGGYIGDEVDKVRNLFGLIRRIMNERKRAFKGISYRTLLDENRAPAMILLVIDNYGGFRQAAKEAYDTAVYDLIKNGNTYGIYMIITGNQIGMSDIPSKIHEGIKSVICLEMNDRMQYLQALRVSRISIYPKEDIRGRGIAYADNEYLEIQTALCSSYTGAMANEGIRSLIGERNSACKGKRAIRIPYVPKKALFGDYLGRLLEEGIKKASLPLGYDTASGELVYINYKKFNNLIITGRKGSGKSNYLRVINGLAGYLGINIIYVNRLEELLLISEKKTGEFKYTLIFMDDAGKMIDKFYVNKYDPETESDIIDIITSFKNVEGDYLEELAGVLSLHKIVMTLRSEDTRLVRGRRIYEAIRDGSVFMHLGGMVDEQSLFEYREISYSRKNVSKKAGEGDVSFVSEDIFSGEVKLPLWEKKMSV